MMLFRLCHQNDHTFFVLSLSLNKTLVATLKLFLHSLPLPSTAHCSLKLLLLFEIVQSHKNE